MADRVAGAAISIDGQATSGAAPRPARARIASRHIVPAGPAAPGLSLLASAPADAADADMAHSGFDHLRVARGWPIASAIARRAEEAAALHHPARNPDLRLRWIEGQLHRRAARIVGRAAGLGRIGRMARHEPVGGPLPDIARHIEQSVAIRRIAADRRAAGAAVGLESPPGEGALPGIRLVQAARRKLVAPD